VEKNLPREKFRGSTYRFRVVILTHLIFKKCRKEKRILEKKKRILEKKKRILEKRNR